MAKTKIKDGYLVFDDENEKPVHKWVAEDKYRGKENIEGKEIHHINGDKLNNDNTNIVALSKEDHFQIHLYNRRLNFALEFIMWLSALFLISVLLGNVLKSNYLLWVSRLSVMIIFFIALESRYNFIGKAIRRPSSKIGE